jgi:ribosome-binding protein aMBF1 (putative translation factor)
LQDKIRALQASKTEEELLQEETAILMANYLSEIERYQRDHAITRKDLAAKIKTSASYLTQVFRGDKPLNFYTIAKIQRALSIRFRVIAIPQEASTSSTITSYYSIKDKDLYENMKTLPVIGGTLTVDTVLRKHPTPMIN